MSTTHTVALKDLPKRLVADQRAKVELAKRGLFDSAHLCMAIAIEKSPSDQDQLRQAWRVEETEDGAMIANDAPHAGIVEMGSRPHIPPFFPILQWLARNRKGGSISLQGLDDPGLTGPYGMAGNPWFAQSPERELLRLEALSVCRAIISRGTKPRRMLGSSQGEFARIVQEITEQVLGGAA